MSNESSTIIQRLTCLRGILQKTSNLPWNSLAVS